MSCGGVRNLIYESHCFGSTFTWLSEHFQIEYAPESCELPETVSLMPREGSNLPDGRIFIEFVEDPNGDGSVELPPNYARAEKELRTKYLFPRVPDDESGTGPHVVFISCTTDDISTFPWEDVRDSIDGPAPNWQLCHEEGVFEVEFEEWDLTEEGLAITLFISNLDREIASFRHEYIELHEIDGSADPPAVRTWTPKDPSAVLTLPPRVLIRPRVRRTLLFPDVTSRIGFELHYVRPTRSIVIADSERITPVPGRPRINPGG